MLDEYLKELDDFILSADEIIKVEILRREIWDTELEKIAIYRYRIHLKDEAFLELTERLLEESGTLIRTKYRFHWQSKDGTLIKRWDNARHHPEIKTFPHHLHVDSDENVLPQNGVSGLRVLKMVLSEINHKSPR
jgi:hypothetical protein